MIEFGTVGAQICVVGPTSFGTECGAVAYGTAETLARNFPVMFRPTEPTMQGGDSVELPNGRRLSAFTDDAPLVSILCDIGGDAWSMLPASKMRYAWLLSGRPSGDCVRRLNEQVDAVLVPSAHLGEAARRSGVTRPITVLPIPLDLDKLLTRPAKPPGPIFTFGSIAADGDHAALIEAFLSRFAHDDTTRLVLQSDSAADPVPSGASNIQITTGKLSGSERADLLASFDAFARCADGETYETGPREALAAGRIVVAPATGNRDLDGIPGVFLVEPPAPDMAQALSAARDFAAGSTVLARRGAARQWSFSALASSVGGLIDPAIVRYRPGLAPSPDVETVIEQRLGRRGDAIGGVRRQVCPAYDAGFFSIFNAFMSHLVWQEREDRCHAVLPDWDIDRLIARFEHEGIPVRSFCYGQPGDGNLWLKLFQPLLGATQAEMQDEAFLWRHAEAPEDRHNEIREPHLTYSRAYTMYRSAEFAAVRRQYHRVFAHHVRLRPDLAAEIETFAAAHLAAPVRIAAHVRHPSHTVEQPGGRIAHTDAYIARVREEVRRRGADPEGGGWAVFVATDQDRVLDRFRAAFGSRAVFYPDARRTRADEDAAFDALSPAEQNREGHQLQHLVAADRSGWHWLMAREVVRDAYTMARCQALLHVVSNVSTAVSYMNPELEMIFCEA